MLNARLGGGPGQNRIKAPKAQNRPRAIRVMRASLALLVIFSLSCAVALPSCSSFMGQAFVRSDIKPTKTEPSLNGIQIVGVTDSVTRQLLA